VHERQEGYSQTDNIYFQSVYVHVCFYTRRGQVHERQEGYSQTDNIYFQSVYVHVCKTTNIVSLGQLPFDMLNPKPLNKS